MLVALGPGDGRQPLLRDTHEVVLGSRRTDRVNGDPQVPVGAVLEAHRERQARGELPVELRLGGPRADGAHGDEVRQELGGDGVQHLGGDGHAPGRQVGEHLARDPQTLVDLEGLVDVRVVDQALPADGRAGLLEVGAHDDAQVVGELVGERLEAVGVLEGGGGVVDGAGPDDDEEPVVLAHDDACRITTTFDHCLEGRFGDRDVLDQESGLDQRVLALNCAGGAWC